MAMLSSWQLLMHLCSGHARPLKCSMQQGSRLPLTRGVPVSCPDTCHTTPDLRLPRSDTLWDSSVLNAMQHCLRGNAQGDLQVSALTNASLPVIRGFRNDILQNPLILDAIHIVTQSPLLQDYFTGIGNFTGDLAPIVRAYTVRAPPCMPSAGNLQDLQNPWVTSIRSLQFTAS